MTVRYSKLLVSLGGMHQATKSASKHIFPARTRPITAGRGVFIGCGCRPWGCIDTRCTAWRFRFRLESLSIFQRRRSLLNLPQLSGFVYSYVHTCGHYCRCDSYCKRCASSTTTLWIKPHHNMMLANSSDTQFGHTETPLDRPRSCHDLLIASFYLGSSIFIPSCDNLPAKSSPSALRVGSLTCSFASRGIFSWFFQVVYVKA